MNPMIFAIGRAADAALTHTPARGDRTFAVANAAAFTVGTPAFLMPPADARPPECLGRVTQVAEGLVHTQWAAQAPHDLPCHLVQPEGFAIAPPHAGLLVYHEFRLGLETIETSGGVHHPVASREVHEVLRLRVHHPTRHLVDDLLQWAGVLATRGEAAFTVCMGARQCYHVELATPNLSVEWEECGEGKPFEMLMRIVEKGTVWLEASGDAVAVE